MAKKLQVIGKLGGTEAYTETEGVGSLQNPTDWDNELWSQWDSRLSFGMEPGNAPAPFKIGGQLFADGTIICHNTGDMAHNRWGFHLLEGYAKDDYSRLTVLVDKHTDETTGNSMVELYFYTGAAHTAASYGGVRVGSDVDKHSFVFDRDTMTAYGQADFKAPIRLSGIDINTDIDSTYERVEDADANYDPEYNADANNKSLQYIRLANAEDGTLFYDEANEKIAARIGGNWVWFAVKTPPAGTYSVLGNRTVATIRWESGVIGGSGNLADNAARIRTVDYLPSDAVTVEGSSDYLYTIVCYNDDGDVAGTDDAPTAYYSPSEGALVAGAAYISDKVYLADVLANVGDYHNFKLIAKRSDGAEVSSSEGENVIVMVTGTATGTESFVDVEWESGVIAGSGNLADNTARIRTVDYLPADALYVKASDGYRYTIVCYNDDGDVGGTEDSPTAYYNPTEGVLVAGATYVSDKIYFADVLQNVGDYHNFKLIVRREDGADIAVTEGANIFIAVSVTVTEPELPVVTEEDNGKFLRVVDGVWAAVAVDSAEGVSF